MRDFDIISGKTRRGHAPQQKPFLFIIKSRPILNFAGAQKVISQERLNEAKDIVAYYTLAATATGAIPVPAASAAIIAENGIMLAHLASALGMEISTGTIIESLGIAGSINIVGRNLFIEGAKLLSWGTGSIWAAAALSALGASTAGVQTYIIGQIAIEIGKNGGKPLSTTLASKVIDDCRESYSSFVEECKKNPPKKPAQEAT